MIESKPMSGTAPAIMPYHVKALETYARMRFN